MPSVKKTRLSIAAAVIAAACVIGGAGTASASTGEPLPSEQVSPDFTGKTYKTSWGAGRATPTFSTTRTKGKPSKPVTSYAQAVPPSWTDINWD